jgi:hypothetical protein
MVLIDDVKRMCDRLAPLGWRDLLLQHSLDITAANLKQELTKELTIQRTLPGFEDFAFEGKRGIETGNPARSLLYHAFASPNVLQGARGATLTGFPTLAELETVENYVFGIQPPSLDDLRSRAQGELLAIAVFASEYRPSPETAHRKHADLCFSRTGVARVGSEAALYDAKARGFLPFVNGNPAGFRVLPARYSAYIAVQRPGSRAASLPMRFKAGDERLSFWVPLHKLFDGTECIQGQNLQVDLNARHVNEKIRRIHIALRGAGGWREPDINNPPFIFTTGIAEFSTQPDLGQGVMVPTVHAKMVEAAQYQGKTLTFTVPPNSPTLSSSLSIPADATEARPAPEYIHARHKVLPDGREENLNDLTDVEAAVRTGGYRAKHYVDFTGDGWVDAICQELAIAIPRRVPAYSLVTAPDFFPNCDQRELLEWTEQSVPTALRQNLWRIPPETLSDGRIAPNLQLQNANFRPEDKTVTTIICLRATPPSEVPIRQTSLSVSKTMRHAHLPDAAAGLFAPGWDVSFDRVGNVQHLATYGLGSPFPEDSKLCAALSTFWPAVAPDAARTFAPDPRWPTISPLTDEEIGQVGDRAWDGVKGPQRVTRNGQAMLLYNDFDHADYVETSLSQKFSLSLTGQVDVLEYESRVLAMANTYRVLGITPSVRGQWGVLSFRKVSVTDTELQQAQAQAGATLRGTTYRMELYRPGTSSLDATNSRQRLVEIRSQVTLFISPIAVLLKQGTGAWVSRML